MCRRSVCSCFPRHAALPVAMLMAAAAVPMVAPAAAQLHQREQDVVRDDLRQGRVLSQQEIEQRILPHMRDYDYLGPEYDRASHVYRMKFMRAGSVLWIDVDGRTGTVIGRSGN